MSGRDYYSSTDIARRWDISNATVIRMINDGLVTGYKIRGVWKIEKNSVEKHEREMKR